MTIRPTKKRTIRDDGKPIREWKPAHKRVLLLDGARLEPLFPTGVNEPGMPTKDEILRDIHSEDRMCSIRAYRRLNDRVLWLAMRGQIAPRDAKSMADMIKASAEMMMAERLLAAQGIEDTETPHVLGDDGGAILPTHIIPHQEITVRREKGIGPDGNEIDKTIVERKGGPGLLPDLDELEAPI